MTAVGSSDVLEMADSSGSELLAELNEKRRRTGLWPFVAGTLAALIIGLLIGGSATWFLISLLILGLAATVVAYQYDVLMNSTVILYDFDSHGTGSLTSLHEAVLAMNRCGGKWHVRAKADVYNKKYHAGAAYLLDRTGVAVGRAAPPRVRTNVPVPYIALGSLTLYFMPERVLVFGGASIGSIEYRDLAIQVSGTTMIEDTAPHDAVVVGATWRYVNRDGGPDGRFKINPRLPVCRYDEIWLSSPNGLSEVVQVSREGYGRLLHRAVEGMATAVAREVPLPAVVEVVSITTSSNGHRAESRGAPALLPAPVPPLPDEFRAADLHTVLFDTLCCMMVADGRASRSEKQCIRELMTAAQSPWSPDETNSRFDVFLARVDANGFRKTLEACLNGAIHFARGGKKAILIEYLDAVSKADGVVTPRESHLLDRIKGLLE